MSCCLCWGQEHPDTLARQRERGIRKSSLIVLPIAFYTPETRFGGGGAGLYTFRFARETEKVRPSQLQLGLAYTQERQILSYLPFDVYFREESWYISGEIGYYRYVYQFFGVGNRTEADSEVFEAAFPRLQLSVQRLVRPGLYVGLRYWMDDYRITSRAAGGLLNQETVRGWDGGFISGVGLTLNYDTRDHLFYPRHGRQLQFRTFFNRKWLGSRYNFDRYSLDLRQYFALKSGLIATNLVMECLSGEVPFQQLALIGGAKRMRGFFEGRFRDRQLWILQAEYRRPVWRFVGLTAFAGAGSVAPDLGALLQEKVHWAYGVGLRIRLSKKDKINLRFDLGWNEESELFPYLTVAEAF